MGSFNMACMLSGMPIGYGTAVRMILIKKSPYKQGGGIGCHPTWLWSPCTVAIRGTYTDYGQIDPHPDDAAMLDLSLKAVNKHLFPVEQGKNEYHDVAVKDISTWENIQDGLRAGRILIQNRHSQAEPSPLTFVYIREDVWQAMLTMENEERTFWRSHRKCGDGTLAGARMVAKAWFDSYLSEVIKEKKKRSKDKNFLGASIHALAGLTAQHRADEKSEFGLWFHSEGHSHIIRLEIIGLMRDNLTNGICTMEDPMFIKLFDALCELDHVNGMMNMPTKLWTPMQSSGQEYHWGTISKFYEKMAGISAAAQKEHEEDC